MPSIIDPVDAGAAVLPGHAALCCGRPRFDAAALSALAQREGDAAAWRRLLDGAADPVAALAGVRSDFAVAAELSDGSSVAAVDRLGVRTLCYRVVQGRLRVAERADELADGSTPVDPQALFDYLYFHAIPAPRTVFQGVFRLPPGHCVRLRDGRLTVQPYWTPEFEEGVKPAAFGALRDEFRDLLRQAVRDRLDGGGRPACFLSGGTDSSSVAGLVREVTGQGAASYSIGFEAEGYDEMAYARIAARHFGAEHHEYYVTPDDLLRSIPRVAAHHDQPFGNSSAVPAFHCALMAREQGVTRLLAGDGGDELFGGNSRYAKQRVFDAYGAVPGALRAGLLEPLLASPLGGLPLLRKGRSYVQQARTPMPDRLALYNLLPRLGLAEVLEPGFLARVSAQAPLQQQREVWAAARAGSDLNRSLAFDWRYTLADSDLPKVRGSCELAGVDVAFPLLDERLLDFSMRLPVSYKLRGLKLRWFFKEALRGFLPDEILSKKKHGFGLPFGVWATRHAGLQALAEESLRAVAERGIVRPQFVDTLLRVHLPAHPGYYGEMVWILLMLEQWLRQYAPGLDLRT